ncbi:phosphatidate cytidylyltransferase [Allofustis seminis]|uniref:phosphatidate cytidylyltransferase n=1 Tax=Allofustis seminis TaxID=166939 RepID=UPI000374448C|nr:phosphatidate cytidylyltransferase [Allofustis seminis]
MKQRIITALILVFVLVPAIIVGGIFWDVLISLIGLGSVYEWQRMNQRKIYNFDTILSFVSVLMMIHFQTILSIFSLSINLVQLVFVIMIIFLTETVWSRSFHVKDAGYSFIGALYIGLGTMSATMIREISLPLILYVIVAITMTDTGAYFVGRTIGKNKLAPEISPNKTIEGAIGGIVFGTALSLLFSRFYPLPDVSFSLVLMSVLLSIVGQLGDLILSCVKRYFGIKDTGKLLPGHGGLLDRFDSFLFGLSVLWIYGL